MQEEQWVEALPLWKWMIQQTVAYMSHPHSAEQIFDLNASLHHPEKVFWRKAMRKVTPTHRTPTLQVRGPYYQDSAWLDLAGRLATGHRQIQICLATTKSVFSDLLSTYINQALASQSAAQEVLFSKSLIYHWKKARSHQPVWALRLVTLSLRRDPRWRTSAFHMVWKDRRATRKSSENV